MADYRIRLTQTLEFDEKREADIIKQVEVMKEQRNLGQFLSSAVRLAVAHPELLEYPLAAYGLKDERSEFFKELQKELVEQSKKIDEVYCIARKTYELALLGKRLALEGKSEQNLRAAFVLERQERELSDKLGLSLTGYTFASSRMEDTQKRAEDVVECAIESYDSILQELSDSLKVNVEAVGVTQTTVAEPQIPVAPVAAAAPIVAGPMVSDEVIDLGPPAIVAAPATESAGQDGDIVFGDGAGLDALSRFLGN